MAREAIEHFPREQPSLVQLRRTFDVIARRYGEAAIPDVLQHAVERVAEFVEERLRIVHEINTGSPGAAFTKLLLFDVIDVTAVERVLRA